MQVRHSRSTTAADAEASSLELEEENVIHTELVRSISRPVDDNPSEATREADRTLARAGLLQAEQGLFPSAERILRLVAQMQHHSADEQAMKAAVQMENRKLRELELLMDVREVVAGSEEQRRSLHDMGVDVEKVTAGTGKLVGAVSLVNLLATTHWTQRMGEVCRAPPGDAAPARGPATTPRPVAGAHGSDERRTRQG